jgi:hypothetical protein
MRGGYSYLLGQNKPRVSFSQAVFEVKQSVFARINESGFFVWKNQCSIFSSEHFQKKSKKNSFQTKNKITF